MAVRDIQLIGDKKLIRKLKVLSSATVNKIVRPSMKRASKPVITDARNRVPMGGTGLLKKSIGRRGKTYKNSGVLVEVIGPRSGFKRTVEIDGKAVIKNPTKYAHLVEFGTSKTGAQPFLRPALASKKSEALRILATEISREIKRQAKLGAT